jgi:hypothetical protein
MGLEKETRVQKKVNVQNHTEKQSFDIDKHLLLTQLLCDSVCPITVYSADGNGAIKENEPFNIFANLNKIPDEWLKRTTPKLNSNQKLLNDAMSLNYPEQYFFTSMEIVGNYLGFFFSNQFKVPNKIALSPLDEEIFCFFKFAEKAVYENLDKAKNIIQKDNGQKTSIPQGNKIFRAVNRTIRITTDNQIKKGCVDFIINNFSDFVTMREKDFSISRGQLIDEFLTSIKFSETITEFGNTKQLKTAKEIIAKMLRSNNDTISNIALGELKRHWINNRTKNVYEFFPDEYGKKLEVIGLNLDSVQVRKIFFEVEPQLLFKNLENIHQLEKQRPGITEFLFNEFGIRHFSRYPEGLLIQQFDEFAKKNNEKTYPYGLIINPKEDYYGAFYDEKSAYDELFKMIDENNFRLRAFEINNVRELIKTIGKSRKNWGKISFIILGGHGYIDAICFNKSNNSKEALTDKMVNSRIGKIVRTAFVTKPTIVVNSCDVGDSESYHGSFCQKISTLNMNAVGVDGILMNIRRFFVNFNDEAINLSFEYKNEDGKISKPNIFSNGEYIGKTFNKHNL